MSEMIPTPEQQEAEQRRIIFVASGIEAVAFATVGALAGGYAVGAIEAHYAQEETTTSATSSRHPEEPFSPPAAAIGAGIGVLAAAIMCWHYIRQNRNHANH